MSLKTPERNDASRKVSEKREKSIIEKNTCHLFEQTDASACTAALISANKQHFDKWSNPGPNHA